MFVFVVSIINIDYSLDSIQTFKEDDNAIDIEAIDLEIII